MSDKPLYCSFCGKSSEEVAKLIAGPTAFICDECTDLCGQIVAEERGQPKDDAGALLAVEHVPPSKLPDYVARLKLALDNEQRGRAEMLRELRDIEFEVEGLFEALLDIAFPEKSGLNDYHGNPHKWSCIRAYEALGGRIENGQRIDSYQDLKGDPDA